MLTTPDSEPEAIIDPSLEKQTSYNPSFLLKIL
jgi:hypothetical protein